MRMPMALKTTCFQMTTIATSKTTTTTNTTTTSRARASHPSFVSMDKSSLREHRRATLAVSSASPFRTGVDRRRSRPVCRAKNTVDEVVVVVEANWQNVVIESKQPVMVEFWAPWCGPCRMIAPVIKELAKDYAGRIVCCQVNTDDCPKIASRFGIRSVPTVLMFKDGEKKESIIGAVPKTTLVAAVDKYLEP